MKRAICMFLNRFLQTVFAGLWIVIKLMAALEENSRSVSLSARTVTRDDDWRGESGLGTLLPGEMTNGPKLRRGHRDTDTETTHPGARHHCTGQLEKWNGTQPKRKELYRYLVDSSLLNYHSYELHIYLEIIMSEKMIAVPSLNWKYEETMQYI